MSYYRFVFDKNSASCIITCIENCNIFSKTVKKKARKDGNNGVDIRKFFAAKERVMFKKATHSKRNKDPIEISDSES